MGLHVIRLFTCERYDPNAEDEERRKELGRSIAMLREDYERLLREGTSPSAVKKRRPWHRPEAADGNGGGG